MKKILLTILIFALVAGGIYFPLSYFNSLKPAKADNTGALTAGANAAKTSGAGDNNGFETSAGSTTALDGTFASSANTGTGNATDGCTTFNQSEDDAHDFYNFGISVPGGSSIDGINVDTNGKWSTNSGTNQFCVALSWDGGTTWTAAQGTGDLQTTAASHALGGSANTWGRTWSTSELSDTNFRLRVMIDPGAANTTTGYLDYLAVTVYYTPPFLGINVSGNVYSDEGTTGLANARTIALRVNGSGTYSTTTIASTGQYNFSAVTINSIGDTITVYLDGDPEQAVTVTRAASTVADITGLDLYQNRVIARYEDSGPLTNSDMDKFDNACNAGTGDTDIQFCADSGNLTISNGAKLIVWTGKTFAPGGTITTSGTSNGDLDVQSSATLSMGSNALTVGGNFTNNGTLSAPSAGGFSLAGNFTNNGTFTHNSGTVTFTGTATSTITGAITFNNFTAITGDKRLAFQAQSSGAPIFTFAGTVTIAGIKDHPVTVRSDTTGAQWLAHFNNPQTITWARVRDSGCDSGTAGISAGIHSNNVGNNGTCWDFVDKSGEDNPVGTSPIGGGPVYTGGGHGADSNGPADPTGVLPPGGGPTQTGNAASGQTIAAP